MWPDLCPIYSATKGQTLSKNRLGMWQIGDV